MSKSECTKVERGETALLFWEQLGSGKCQCSFDPGYRFPSKTLKQEGAVVQTEKLEKNETGEKYGSVEQQN